MEPARVEQDAPMATVVQFPTDHEPGVDKHKIAEILDVSVSWVEKRCIAKQDRIPSYKDKAGRRRFRPSVCQRWFNQDGEG